LVAEGATLALGGPFAMLPLLEGAPGGFDMDAMKVLDSIRMSVQAQFHAHRRVSFQRTMVCMPTPTVGALLR